MLFSFNVYQKGCAQWMHSKAVWRNFNDNNEKNWGRKIRQIKTIRDRIYVSSSILWLKTIYIYMGAASNLYSEMVYNNGKEHTKAPKTLFTQKWTVDTPK